MGRWTKVDKMPLLTYSGRPQSKKWVRTAAPKVSAAPEANVGSSRTVPASLPSDTTPSTAGSTALESFSKTLTTKQPKLSGPKNMHSTPLVQKTTWKRARDGNETETKAAAAFVYPSSSVAPSVVKPSHISLGSNTWKRENTAGDKAAPSSLSAAVGNSHSMMDASIQSSVAVPKPIVQQQQSMIRHGAHSLALKRKVPSSSASNIIPAALPLPPSSRTWKRPRTNNEEETATKESSVEVQKMAHSGVGGGPEQAKHLLKIAPNKLVHGRGPVQQHHPPAKNPPRPSHGPVIMRIKLAVHPDHRELSIAKSNSSDGGTSSKDDVEDAGQPAASEAACISAAAPKPEKQLTDFAYRSLSTKTSTRHHLKGRRPAHSLHHNALVRVDPSKKPICPTYLKGQDCVNERCMLRHDVPLEYCRPVCSFFQHQGMCLRDNCPFRHVKLERGAIPCPSFELYGYCQDEKCPMMHASRKKKVNVIGSVAK